MKCPIGCDLLIVAPTNAHCFQLVLEEYVHTAQNNAARERKNRRVLPLWELGCYEDCFLVAVLYVIALDSAQPASVVE